MSARAPPCSCARTTPAPSPARRWTSTAAPTCLDERALMEKVIYLLWRDPATTPDAFAAAIHGTLVPQLREANARQAWLNIADADVAKAVGLKQVLLKPQPEAVVQVWVDSAIAHLRAPVDAAVARIAPKYAAYLVTESQPIVN